MIKFFDGAFGTYYFSKTGDTNPCELANITNKAVALDIHREYIAAGANAIKTNTFWANGVNYSDRKLREIIIAGYSLARQAAADSGAEVFGDIGNIDFGNSPKTNPENMYIQIAEIFIELGAVNFIFETLDRFDLIKPALELIKAKVKNAVILASFAVSQDGYSRKGLYYKELISEAEKNPDVDIVGLNCVCGPAHLLNLTKELGKISKPLSIMPNAGYPSTINGRTVFRDNAEYFARKISQIHNIPGVNILGGCCGTTPAHIKSAIDFIKNTERKETEIISFSAPLNEDSIRLPLKPLLVELDPPVDNDFSFISNAVDMLKSRGATTITLTDSPLAKARADSFLTAAKVKAEKNIDVLPHISCRDKNHIAIKGSLMGAYYFGINKVLAVTGDPMCDSNKRSGVFDFNSQTLISYIKNLNSTLFNERPFSIGGAINVNAVNFDAELLRCAKKLESGADFLLSQPIYTALAAENFNKAKEKLGCELYAGILPVASYKNALFLNNEVAGIDIPKIILDALKNKEQKEVYDISINFSRESVKAVYDSADGFYIMTPLKKVDLVSELIKGVFL